MKLDTHKIYETLFHKKINVCFPKVTHKWSMPFVENNKTVPVLETHDVWKISAGRQFDTQNIPLRVSKK